MNEYDEDRLRLAIIRARLEAMGDLTTRKPSYAELAAVTAGITRHAEETRRMIEHHCGERWRDL